MDTTYTHIYEGLLAQAQNKNSVEKTYFHLPFEMPSGAVRLQVSLSYNDRIGSNPALTGGNTVDLGVFDERGIDFLTAGFRGWSGSERDDFWIDEREATPGYLAGPLNAGRWHVLLGLYKVAPTGCAYRVAITITTGEPARPPADVHSRALPSSPPPAVHAPWLRGELHCHTWHSDGVLSVPGLLEHARARGMDFLAISDHNTIASQYEMENLSDPGMILIRGLESTTYAGHFNAWGISDWVDFRVQTPEQMAAALEYANRLGALTSCGHPKPLGPAWDFPQVTAFTCVEVWNGPWNGLNEVSLAYWLDLLAAGHRKPAVGGSDYHHAGEMSGGRQRDLGTPTNWVYAPAPTSSDGILQSIRQGHVSLSDEPDGPLLILKGGPEGAVLQGDAMPRPASGYLPLQVTCERGTGCVLRLLDDQGILAERAIASDWERLEFNLPVFASRYVRAELRKAEPAPAGWLRALTNPIYFNADAH